MTEKTINRLGTMATNKKQEGSSGLGNLYVLTLCLACLGISFISMYAVIILLFGLLPGLIAIIIDQEHNRFISKIVLSLNFSGVSPYLIKIISEGSERGNMLAISLIIDPKTWMVIYGAAAIGWFIYWVFPQVAIFYSNIVTQIRVKKLEKELAALAEEWGEEIKGGK